MIFHKTHLDCQISYGCFFDGVVVTDTFAYADVILPCLLNAVSSIGDTRSKKGQWI